MKHRVVLKKSIFPASWDMVWEKLQQLATLQYIAKPFASFLSFGKKIKLFSLTLNFFA